MQDKSQIQQTLFKSLYEYMPSISESVYKQKNNITSSIHSAFNNTVTKINQMKTNIIYTIKHSEIKMVPIIHRQEIVIKEGTSAQLLGQIYRKDNDYNFLYMYRNTFWFTYREGIKEIESDNGWGCMIRTVQMVLAQTIARNLKLKYTQEDQYQVIRDFSEVNEGALSLYEICKEGKIDKRWTSSVQIFAVVKKIISKYPEHFKLSIEMLSSGASYKNINDQIFPKYPVLLNLSNRVSLTEIPPEFHNHYFEMMNHPSWVGSIGGIKGQALYIIGSYENKVIFLDPHYVQSNQQQLEVQTYFNKTPRGIQISALSPSLTFCYYFQNEQKHLKWIEWISKLTQKHYPNVIFQYFDEETKNKLNSSQLEQKQRKCEIYNKQMPIVQQVQVINKKISQKQEEQQVQQEYLKQLQELQNIENIEIVEMNNDSMQFQIL